MQIDEENAPLIEYNLEEFQNYKTKIILIFQWIFQLFIPSKIYLKFLLASFIPAISTELIPLFFTGQIPNESALSIVSQYVFISLLIGIVQESICESLFFFIGQNYKNRRVLALQGLKLGLLILFIIGSVLTGILIIFLDNFISVIDTPDNIQNTTRLFLLQSSFSFPLQFMNAALLNYFYISTSALLIPAQTFLVLWSFLLNFFLFGNQNASLHWSVNGLGYYKIIQNVVDFLSNIVFLLIIEKISPWTFLVKIPLLKDIRIHSKSLFSVSWGNFGHSLVKNAFNFLVILKFLNVLGEIEIGAWNVCNTIVFGILLIPINSIGSYCKVRLGHFAQLESQELRKNIKIIFYEAILSLVSWLLLMGLLAGFFWSNLAGYFSPTNNLIAQKSTQMFQDIGWVYITWAFTITIQGGLVGLGRTDLIFYQTLISKFGIYFIPWILYMFGVIQPTYWWVMGLFETGLVFDLILSIIYCKKVWINL